MFSDDYYSSFAFSDDYVAGVLDSRLAERRRRSYVERLTLAHSQLAVLEELERRFGGSVNERHGRWSVASDAGMKAVRDHQERFGAAAV